MATNQNQTLEHYVDSTEEPPADDLSDTQEVVAATFGDGGGLGETYGVTDATVGDDEIVMWFPQSATDPIGIPLVEFSEAADRTTKYTEIAGDTVAVSVVNGDDVAHPIQQETVQTLADALDMGVSELMERAAVNEGYETYPVLFDLTESDAHDGQIMIAPVANDVEEMADTAPSDTEV